MHIARRKTRQISVGTVKVGGDAPVSVQSMCSTDTRDVTATVAEIHRLEAAGCEIIRVAVPDEEAAAVLPQIKAAMTVPLIADIHFDHRLALKAAADRRLRPYQSRQYRRLVESGRSHQSGE